MKMFSSAGLQAREGIIKLNRGLAKLSDSWRHARCGLSSKEFATLVLKSINVLFQKILQSLDVRTETPRFRKPTSET